MPSIVANPRKWTRELCDFRQGLCILRELVTRPRLSCGEYERRISGCARTLLKHLPARQNSADAYRTCLSQLKIHTSTRETGGSRRGWQTEASSKSVQHCRCNRKYTFPNIQSTLTAVLAFERSELSSVIRRLYNTKPEVRLLRSTYLASQGFSP